MGEKITAWITKYALTEGIQRVENATVCSESILRVDYEGSCITSYFHGRAWHRTEMEAIERAEEMRIAKLKSLRRTMEKVEALRFTPCT